MPKPSREKTLPLATQLARKKGEVSRTGHVQRKVLPLLEPYKFEMWFPCTPRPKSQGWPKVNRKTGRPYIAHDEDTKEHEDKLRVQFLKKIEEEHPQLIQHLPLLYGYAKVQVRTLLEPFETTWFDGPTPAMPTTPPYSDDEAYGKIVKDAVAGRQSKSMGLLWWDDIITVDTFMQKRYWNPFCSIPGYPPEPGHLLIVELYPEPRHPAWLPPEQVTCPNCYRSNFRAEWSFRKHLQHCLPDS